MPVFCSLLRRIKSPCYVCIDFYFYKAIALMNVAVTPYSRMRLYRNL